MFLYFEQFKIDMQYCGPYLIIERAAIQDHSFSYIMRTADCIVLRFTATRTNKILQMINKLFLT